MSSNGWGNVKNTRESQMDLYDGWAPDVRELLQLRVAPWEVSCVLDGCRAAFARYGSRRTAIAAVEYVMSSKEAEDTYRTYGPTHPQANNNGRSLKPDFHKLWGKTA